MGRYRSEEYRGAAQTPVSELLVELRALEQRQMRLGAEQLRLQEGISRARVALDGLVQDLERKAKRNAAPARQGGGGVVGEQG